MSLARGAFGRAPYAGSIATEAPAPPGQQTIPPPIPGGTAKWVYRPHHLLAYGWRSFAGRTSQQTYPGGGVSIRPVPEVGVMRVSAWWPDASALQIVRVHSDGSAWPVRNASPLEVGQPTRRNWCTNPTLEVGLNGYVAGDGTPTLSRPDDGTASEGAYYIKAVNASAGSNGLVIPTAIPGGGNDLTVAFDLRLSAQATSFTITVTWSDSAGIPLPASSATLTANEINQSVDQFARQLVRVSTPPAGVTATVKVVAGGMPAGGVMSLDQITVERGATDGSPFSGSTYGATWLGTTGLSASTLAPVLEVDDGECPVDSNVYYRVINPRATGGTMSSEPALLDSLGKTWLTHPLHATAPRRIVVKAVPTRTREAKQGVFVPVNGRYATVVSEARRRAPTGEFSLYAMSWAERDALVELFDDMLPVLVRAPGTYGYGNGMWLSLGSMDEDAEGRLAPHDARLFSAPFVEVAPYLT